MKNWLLAATLIPSGLALAATDSLPCLIDPSEVVSLGSPVVGVLDRIVVERGDIVKRNQIIAELSAEVERKSVELASGRANDLAELQAAAAAREHAQREKQRALQLFEKQLISKQIADQAVTEHSLAEHKYQQAKSNLSQAKLELGLTKAQLEQRILRSPIDGIVVDRFTSAGQRIQDQPLVKIAKVNPLKVEVIVPAEHYNKLNVGDEGQITPSLPGFTAQTATIRIVDRIIDPASNTFRVTLELPNPKHAIPAGSRCTASLDLK
ncbi:MAG: efflux RND transporter periplasmic adaptor subunit [Thiotrichales bacterium]